MGWAVVGGGKWFNGIYFSAVLHTVMQHTACLFTRYLIYIKFGIVIVQNLPGLFFSFSLRYLIGNLPRGRYLYFHFHKGYLPVKPPNAYYLRY